MNISSITLDRRRRSKANVALIVGLVLGVQTLRPAEGAVRLAKSASYSDVSMAVGSAESGDTVTIPPGTSVWTNTLVIKKGINLLGSGTNATLIVASGVTPIHFNLTADQPLRLGKIAFTNGLMRESVLITASGSVGVSNFRVDHCMFLGGKRAVHLWKRAFGVIDHCTFQACHIAVGSTGDNNAAWARPLGLGSTNCVVIENCSFFLPDNSQLESQIYHQEGTRTVVRRCLFKATTGDPAFIECHGNQNYLTGGSTDYRGTVFLEVYDNEFSIGINNYRFLHLRGGTILAFRNAFKDLSGATPLMHLTEEESWQTMFFSPLAKVYPAQDQIRNSFFWSNTLNGTNSNRLVIDQASSEFIKENRDFWLAAPSTNNGVPVGALADYAELVYPHPRVTVEEAAKPSVVDIVDVIPLN